MIRKNSQRLILTNINIRMTKAKLRMAKTSTNTLAINITTKEVTFNYGKKPHVYKIIKY